MALAKKAAEVCLEKSALGGLFDNININGNWDTQMWASLSKAYATHAAAQFNGAKYTGFVGMGSSADQSIFNKIEQPQFASMLSEKQKIDLKIDWYAAAGDPKTKMNEPDERFEASGVKGVYAKGERAAMVDKAETENKRRLELWEKDKIDEGPEGAAGEEEGGTLDPVVTPGSMEGESHTLTVSGDGVVMASVPAPLDTKVGKARKNVADAVGQLPEGGTQADADRILGEINADLEKIKKKLDKIPKGKTDKLPAGYVAKRGATANANLTQVAKDIMALSEKIMSAVNTYGAKFKVKDLDDKISDRYPTPDVGLHTVTPSAKNAAIVAPDNLPRESHHVPNNELFQTLLEELNTVGTSIAKRGSTLGFKKKSGYRKLGEAMQATHTTLAATHKADGTGLSAILVHRITHQNINQGSGTAVHSKGMAALIEAAIKQEEDALNVEYERIATSKGISVKPTSKEWKPYVASCKAKADAATTAAEKRKLTADCKVAQDAEAEIKVASRKEKNALERIAAAQIRPTLRSAFESGFGHTYNAIKAALQLSRVDGKDGEKTAALTKLRDLAKRVWTPLVEAQFTIPDDELDF